MRLLHVSQPTTEGTAAVVAQLTAGAVRAGHDVTVACPRRGTLARDAEEAGAKWRELQMFRGPGLRDLKAVLQLRRMMREYEVVHLHSSKAGAVGRIAAATMRKTPAIAFTPHGWSWFVGGRMGRVYRWFEEWASRYAQAIIAVSPEEMAEGLKWLPHRAALRVIPNGVDVERFHPPLHARDSALLVCVGRLSQQKGQDRLIRAMAQLKRGTMRLTLVGDGPDRSHLEQLATNIGVADEVDFTGTIDPIPYLHSAAILLIPSRWEGMSIAMLEAMATGNCILATGVGGSKVLEGAGEVLDVTDRSEAQIVARLAAVIKELSQNPALRDELRVKARARVVAEYSSELCIEEHLQMWSQLSKSQDGEQVAQGPTDTPQCSR